MYKKTVAGRFLTKKEFGFSLIDLLFTLTLSAILLGLAFPAYEHISVEIRLLTLAERLSSALHYAQSEAIRHRSSVFLCPSENGKTCSGEWHNGWVLVLDRYKKYFSEKNVLRIYPPLTQHESLTWRAAIGRNYVQLNPDGSAYGHNGSFVICIKTLTTYRVWLIKLSSTGKIKVDKRSGMQNECDYL